MKSYFVSILTLRHEDFRDTPILVGIIGPARTQDIISYLFRLDVIYVKIFNGFVDQMCLRLSSFCVAWVGQALIDRDRQRQDRTPQPPIVPDRVTRSTGTDSFAGRHKFGVTTLYSNWRSEMLFFF